MKHLLCRLHLHHYQPHTIWMDTYGIWISYKCDRCGKDIETQTIAPFLFVSTPYGKHIPFDESVPDEKTYELNHNARVQDESDPAQDARDRNLDLRIAEQREMAADGYKTLLPGWTWAKTNRRLGSGMLQHGDDFYPTSTTSSPYPSANTTLNHCP